MSTGFERRVKRLRERVLANQKKATEPTKAQLMAILDEKGVEYNKSATKAELLDLLNSADQEPEGEAE